MRWYRERWVRNPVLDVFLKRLLALAVALLVSYAGLRLLLASYADDEPLLGQHRLKYPLMLVAFLGCWVLWSAASLVIDSVRAIRRQRLDREGAAHTVDLAARGATVYPSPNRPVGRVWRPDDS